MEGVRAIQYSLATTSRQLTYCIIAKISMILINLVVGVGSMYNMQTKGTAIGLSFFVWLTLFIFFAENGPNRFMTLWNNLKQQFSLVCFFFLICILTLNVPMCSLLSVPPLAYILTNQTLSRYRQYVQQGKSIKEVTIELAWIALAAGYWELIMLRSQQIITVSWNLTLLPIYLTALAVLIFITYYSYMAIRQIPQFRLFDDDLDQTSLQQEYRGQRSVIPLLFISFLTYVGLTIEHLLTSQTYQTLQFTCLALNATELLIYSLFFNKIIIFLNPDHVRPIVSITKNGTIKRISQISNRKLVVRSGQDRNQIECLLCDRDATIMHNCNSLVLCAACYLTIIRKKVMGARCPKCRVGYGTYHTFYTFYKGQELERSIPNSVLAKILGPQQMFMTIL